MLGSGPPVSATARNSHFGVGDFFFQDPSAKKSSHLGFLMEEVTAMGCFF